MQITNSFKTALKLMIERVRESTRGYVDTEMPAMKGLLVNKGGEDAD